MKSRDPMIEIVRRREQLLARCDMQRSELAAFPRQLEGPLKIADRVIAGINFLRRHPLVLGVAVAALVIIERRGWWGWVKRAFVLWRAYRTLRVSKFKLPA